MTATQLQYMQVWAAARLTKWAIFPLLWRDLLSGIIDNITTVNALLQAITGGFYADMVQGLRLSHFDITHTGAGDTVKRK